MEYFIEIEKDQFNRVEVKELLRFFNEDQRKIFLNWLYSKKYQKILLKYDEKIFKYLKETLVEFWVLEKHILS